MAISVDRSAVNTQLIHSLERVEAEPRDTCPIKFVIDFILEGKNCQTYRYILFTALATKSTDESIDIMSLQANDPAQGSYDARSLCKNVVYPFQFDFLNDALGGSNEDPLVNNPGRNLRISIDNKVAKGDPARALELLCEALPSITTSSLAQECLDYFMTRCLERARQKREQAVLTALVVEGTTISSVRALMDELLDKNFGGAALTLVSAAIFSTIFLAHPETTVTAHPVNQSGSSSRQLSDLDVFDGNAKPLLAIELKDKPFKESEVRKAARTACSHCVPSMLFIAGRSSQLTDDIYRYFGEVKRTYSEKGMMVGVMTIDALMDFFFTTYHNADPASILSFISSAMDQIKASPETSRWVYKKMREL